MGDSSSSARLEPFLRLPVGALESLAASLADGLLSGAITLRGVEQSAGEVHGRSRHPPRFDSFCFNEVVVDDLRCGRWSHDGFKWDACIV